MKEYDFIVIGAGPAAINFSKNMKNAEKSILVIEGDKFGGTCPNYGCEPKIFLEGAVRNVLGSQALLGRGIEQVSRINWAKLMQTKKVIWKTVPQGEENNFKKQNVETLYGLASFVDNHTVEVNGQKYKADKIIIATGEKPRKLNFPGNEYTHNSNDVLDLDKLPKTVTFIGAGIVSMELATVLSAAGADVSIVEFLDRPMKAFSSKHVLNTVAEMKKRGIKFYFGQEVSEIKRAENSFTVITSKDTQIQADYVVDASGRIANIDRLKLENTDVKTDKHGVIVNDHLQTAADNIYALGDVISKKEPKLVPTAKFEAEYLTHAFINNDNTPIKYPIIGSSAFTFPQIAQVGVNVDEARDNVDYTVKDIDKLSHSDMEYAGRNDQSAKLSLVFNKKGELVGAAESSQTAVNDINGYIPLIGLHVTKQQIHDNYQLIFPAVSFKTEATI
ncbi:dihydrolipoyl dehydrogenase family protein [Lactobacillus ultunensis]|uniref:Pyridine nucleotide-disulfide oxidoreductase n=1 Tax=Lactobacillus ultunensis DSM 16047 TaxID=525365 RepID=C2EN94_9LACO|nr:NAD(P)/FAD-dependent oxidoreductase [Lactobacillus ultunensis]EEJ71898.1 pyridine nucleotide-disulfide oxidoreductase [Lactobacillus ultunensis DSM 16047]KRL82103.1 glutathione-disulfide reductase [Lactobacillus ultunensis DSM 16047]QQP27686.1 NAD(P)/FAD-dependent oxidoreductase [Lactobacillus ultunensis]